MGLLLMGCFHSTENDDNDDTPDRESEPEPRMFVSFSKNHSEEEEDDDFQGGCSYDDERDHRKVKLTGWDSINETTSEPPVLRIMVTDIEAEEMEENETSEGGQTGITDGLPAKKTCFETNMSTSTDNERQSSGHGDISHIPARQFYHDKRTSVCRAEVERIFQIQLARDQEKEDILSEESSKLLYTMSSSLDMFDRNLLSGSNSMERTSYRSSCGDMSRRVNDNEEDNGDMPTIQVSPVPVIKPEMHPLAQLGVRTHFETAVLDDLSDLVTQTSTTEMVSGDAYTSDHEDERPLMQSSQSKQRTEETFSSKRQSLIPQIPAHFKRESSDHRSPSEKRTPSKSCSPFRQHPSRSKDPAYPEVETPALSLSEFNSPSTHSPLPMFTSPTPDSPLDVLPELVQPSEEPPSLIFSSLSPALHIQAQAKPFEEISIFHDLEDCASTSPDKSISNPRFELTESDFNSASPPRSSHIGGSAIPENCTIENGDVDFNHDHYSDVQSKHQRDESVYSDSLGNILEALDSLPPASRQKSRQLSKAFRSGSRTWMQSASYSRARSVNEEFTEKCEILEKALMEIILKNREMEDTPQEENELVVQAIATQFNSLHDMLVEFETKFDSLTQQEIREKKIILERKYEQINKHVYHYEQIFASADENESSMMFSFQEGTFDVKTPLVDISDSLEGEAAVQGGAATRGRAEEAARATSSHRLEDRGPLLATGGAAPAATVELLHGREREEDSLLVNDLASGPLVDDSELTQRDTLTTADTEMLFDIHAAAAGDRLVSVSTSLL